jgi:hypothetical protein
MPRVIHIASLHGLAENGEYRSGGDVWMDLKLTFLGRVASRWRVRVELPLGFRPRGLTVGLWGEDDKPLGPAMVAPAGTDRVWDVELAGPSPLPPGTLVRCMADVDGGAPMVYWLGVDRRRGLHAFLHADGRLPVDSDCVGSALGPKDIARLAAAFPWVRAEAPTVDAAPEDDGAHDGPSAADDGLTPELRAMLREEFGVDDDDLLDFMKS